MTDMEYDVIEYGAMPNNGEPNTVAIQSAIDIFMLYGGGVVRIPSGTSLSGALVIRDNVTVHLEGGAVLKGFW